MPPLIKIRKVPSLTLADAAAALVDAARATDAHLIALPASADVTALLIGKPPRPVPAPRPPGPRPAADLPGGSLLSVEALLHELVAAALGKRVAEIDRDATFPSLGLDSLGALDVVKRLEERLGRELMSTVLYEHDTIARAALAIVASPSLVAAAAPTSAALAPVQEGEPLLPTQLSFFAQRAFFPDMPGNVLLAADVDDLRGPLTRAELLSAIAVLVERHEALAVVVARRGKDLLQLKGPPPEVRLVDRLDAAREDELADEPFDLTRGPLFRVVTDGRRLLLNGHHCAVDAWSVRNVFLELLAVLAAHRDGRAPELVPLSSTLGAAMAALRVPAPAASVAWFRARLDGVPPLHLPWCAPVDAPSAGAAAVARVVLDAAATAQVQVRAAAAGVTLPAWALGAWMRALFDATGQHDVVVRTAQGKRTARLPDVELLVGAFADALPVRAEVRCDDDTAAVARRVQAFLTGAAAHAAVSALELADAAPRTTAGPVGITPVGFSFPLLPSGPRVAGFTLSDVVGRAGAGFTRATLVAFIVDGRLHLCLNHARSHLSAAAAAALTAVTARHLIDEAPAAEPTTLHGRVLARCALHPDRIAVDGLSYGQLARRSAAVSVRLPAPCRRVAVFAVPGADATVALLAVLRSGAAYVPLDPHWPDARVAQILVAAQVGALVTTADLAGRARRLAAVPVEVVDAREQEHGPCAADARPAYIMYTSGSTGKPKGVVVSHRACLHFQEWVRRAFGVTEADRFAQTSSLAFGGSVRQVFSALLAGASIHPVAHDVLRDPDALVRFLHKERITIWNSVPSLWVHLMDAVERATLEQPFRHVRCVLIGGEPVPAAQVQRWRRLAPSAVGGDGSRCRLFNLYGSVETIVNATWFEVVRDPDPGDRHTPIGWPRAGTQVALRDVTADGVGEIVVAGAIADSYFDDSEATEASFGFSGAQPSYCTGDLARRLPGGAYVHLGRRDGQVQVRGNRVELVEIEHTLAQHPRVRHAVVTWVDERLVASVELTPASDPAPDLRGFVEARLPAFMVPNRINIVVSLPRTPAGKADRIALRAHAAGAEVLTGAASATTRPAITTVLAAAWRAVLALPADPGSDDDFFALGGDSIRALEVLDRVRAQVDAQGTALRPMALYQYRRFGELARALDAALAAKPVDHAAAPTASADGAFGLSSVQRGFWLAQQVSGRSPTWAARVPLHGPLDLVAFNRALTAAVARHPALRTAFTRRADATVEQRPLADMPVPVVVVTDLTGLDPTAQERQLDALFDAATATHFEPVRPPLFTLAVVRSGVDLHDIVLASHHIISDAWSCFALLAELTALHDAFVAGRPAALPALSFTLRDVVAMEPTRATATEERFWRDALRGVTQAKAPPGDERACRIELPAAVLAAVAKTARTHRTTPYAVVLGLYAEALAEATGLTDIVISTAMAGRASAHDGMAHIVGPLARALPVRLQVPFRLRDVTGALVAAFAHSDVPPLTIASAAGKDVLERLGRFFLSWLDPGALPLPTSTLVPDWRRSRFRFAAASTGTEVMVGAMPHPDGLTLHVHGGRLVDVLAPLLEQRLRRLERADAALIIYAPASMPLPIAVPTLVEQVTCRLGTSDIVLLPFAADQLPAAAALDDAVGQALKVTGARVVALAGMLPSLMGLGLRHSGLGDRIVTTGHAATVAAMLLTVQRVLAETGASFADAHVGVLGFGSIGRATWLLCQALLGEPASFCFLDPRVAGSAPSLAHCDLIIGATSGGAGLDVGTLMPGCMVVDDSFPRAFDDDAAWCRMRDRGDVLLVGGGMLDVGPLVRTSPFAQAAAVHARLPSSWLPGCQVEALLVARLPSLGPTRGPIDTARARAVLEALGGLGLTAPPLHLGPDVIPAAIVTKVAQARTAARCTESSRQDSSS